MLKGKCTKFLTFQISKEPGVIEAWQRDGAWREEAYFQWRGSGEKVYSHPRDGTRWQDKKGNHERTVMLQLYSDDVRHAGSSSRSTKDHNICHAYVTVMNVPAAALRKVGTYWTHHLSFGGDYAKDEEGKQWGTAMKELDLLCKDGIVLADGNWWEVKLFVLTGDQMELNKRAGLMYAFGGRYVDRYSFISREVRKTATQVQTLIEGISEKRTPAAAENDTVLMEEGTNARGTERRPLLNNVHGYNVFEEGATAPCPGHDLHTGVFKKDMGSAILCWVQKKWITLSEASDCINEFKLLLRGKDESNYLGECNLKKVSGEITIPGNMIQSRTLVRFLPLVMRKMLINFPMAENHCSWKLIQLMCQLQRGFQSFAVSESQRVKLDNVYKKYMHEKMALDAELKEMIGKDEGAGNSVICKHVTVLHYSDLIAALGPLANYSTYVQEC